MKKDQSASSSSAAWAITLFAIGVFMATLDNGIISAVFNDN